MVLESLTCSCPLVHGLWWLLGLEVSAILYAHGYDQGYALSAKY